MEQQGQQAFKVMLARPARLEPLVDKVQQELLELLAMTELQVAQAQQD
jgi:hypothetical protein